jgi:DNA polymerase-3 subunit gamma/tau
MALVRLAYAADLPGPEEALKRLQNGDPIGGGPSGGGGQAAAAAAGGGGAVARSFAQAQPQPVAGVVPTAALKSFEDVMALIDKKRDITLKLDIERYVRPISFRPGAIEYEPAPGAPANLAQRLVGRLKEWTGERWLIAAQGGGGAESLWEKQKREARETRARIEQDPFIVSVMSAFPGAEIVSIRNLPQPDAPAAASEDEAESDED